MNNAEGDHERDVAAWRRLPPEERRRRIANAERDLRSGRSQPYPHGVVRALLAGCWVGYADHDHGDEDAQR